uniref:Polycystin cation channel PKD1/PKD2 domain-containing protein n=1 Tax=Hemiselmis andersenii TaxID=464988 RepID=A0A7S1H787_HEMAN|mmetsp:Transcript_3942/g.9665  ORF Transcript_3942/g.9665 Transcript_3942/m.9665 type:complete len:612 (+) Transcript_3942:77-1912(+)
MAGEGYSATTATVSVSSVRKPMTKKDAKLAKQLAMLEANAENRFDIPAWLKEVVAYMVFLVAFSVLVFASRNNTDVVSYATHWKDFVEFRSVGVTTPARVENFLQEFLIEDIFKQDYFTIDNYTAPGTSAYVRGSAIIGPVILRQVRVLPVACGAAHESLKGRGLVEATECYPTMSEGDEDTTYTKQQAVVPQWVNEYDFFTYSDKTVTKRKKIDGIFAQYPAGGFVAKMTKDNAPTVLQQITSSSWLDPKTRALVVDIIAYSPQTDLFADVQVLFEYLPGGMIEHTVNVKGMFLDRYAFTTLFQRSIVGLEFVVYAVVFWYLYTEIQEMRIQGRALYWSQGWNWVDWSNLIMFLLVLYYKVINYFEFGSMFQPEDAEDPERIAQQIDALGNSLLVQDQINGFNGFVLWLKLFRYVAITRRMLRLSNVTVVIIYDVVSFCVLFFVVSYAFVIFGHLLFKSKVNDYQTAVDTAITLMRGVYGDIDLDTTIEAVGTWGFLYFFFWLLVSKTLLLNVIIAILMEAYRSVLAQEKVSGTKTVFEKIQDELRLQRAETGGDTVFYRFAKTWLDEDADANPQIAQDPVRTVKKRLGWHNDGDWVPYGAQPRRPDTPP